MVLVCEVPVNAHSDDGDRETSDGDMLQGQSCLSQQPVSTVGALPSSAHRVWEELVGSSLVLIAWDSGQLGAWRGEAAGLAQVLLPEQAGCSVARCAQGEPSSPGPAGRAGYYQSRCLVVALGAICPQPQVGIWHMSAQAAGLMRHKRACTVCLIIPGLSVSH